MIVRHEKLHFTELPGRTSADPLAGQNRDFSMRIVRVAPQPKRSPHRHPSCDEVIYVVHGTGLFWSNGDIVPVGEGDTVVVDAGVAHATLADPGSEMELLCFFPRPDLASASEELHDIVIVNERSKGRR